MAICKIFFDYEQKPGHTHYLLSNGAVTPIKKHPGKRYGDIIVFPNPVPLDEPVCSRIITVGVNHSHPEFQVVGFTRELI